MSKKITYGLEGCAERLQEAWLDSGKSKSQLAREIGVDRKTLYAYLNGDLVPNAATFGRICKSLHISADWALFGYGPAPTSPWITDRNPTKEEQEIMFDTGCILCIDGVDGNITYEHAIIVDENNVFEQNRWWLRGHVVPKGIKILGWALPPDWR